MKIKCAANLKLALLFPAFLCLTPTVANAAPAADVAYFGGTIDEAGVQGFLSKYAEIDVKTLEITSQGGATLPAIELANWVHDKGVTVVVRTLCASACANFVFAAAPKKIILNHGLVVWHGSAEQKDIRELQEKHRTWMEGVRTGQYSLDSPEAAYVRGNQKKYDFIELQRLRQAEFYRAIEVNEAICRLGQEPIAYPVEWWTATPEVMEKFGIKNVSAPNTYGTASYRSRNLIAQFLLKGKS